MVKTMLFPLWVDLLRGCVGTVINIQKHFDSPQTILIKISTNDGKEYIMDEAGLVLVVETNQSDTVQICRKPSDTIQISIWLLNDYYNASTSGQKQYMNDNFKIDGTTTVEAIIRLEELACDDWKHIIRKNHPECFPSPEFDFSEYNETVGSDIFTTKQSKLLGFNKYKSPIQIRNNGKYQNKGFYLTNEVEWKLVEEKGAQILLPIKK
jgi:hypothetical protein